MELAAAQTGSAAARRRFVEVYQDRVFRLLRRIIAPSRLAVAEVEDLAQETFLRAFAALARFRADGAARLSTWLLTIATRLALDALRSRNRAAVPTAELDAVPTTRGNAETQLLGDLLCRAMAELAPDQRAVFVLREYHGMDYQEIAEALDVPAGTVASRLSRARAELQRALGGEDE